MNRKNTYFISSLIVMVTIITIPIIANTAAEPFAVTLKTIPSQTVIYTLHRGHYDKLGESIGMLYALTQTKGQHPIGPVWSVHLNNSDNIDSKHWLTEIRIPVKEVALNLTGTLGDMTDVKKLPEITVATAVKPKGVDDPTEIYKRLYQWIYANGYQSIDAPMQKVISTDKRGNYAQMQVAVMVPIEKVSKL